METPRSVGFRLHVLFFIKLRVLKKSWNEPCPRGTSAGLRWSGSSWSCCWTQRAPVGPHLMFYYCNNPFSSLVHNHTARYRSVWETAAGSSSWTLSLQRENCNYLWHRALHLFNISMFLIQLCDGLIQKMWSGPLHLSSVESKYFIWSDSGQSSHLEMIPEASLRR